MECSGVEEEGMGCIVDVGFDDDGADAFYRDQGDMLRVWMEGRRTVVSGCCIFEKAAASIEGVNAEMIA